MLHDVMSVLQEVGEKIWCVNGERPGPCLVILGGVHGNERTGIELIKRLYRVLDSQEKKLVRGQLFFVLGNPRAMEKNVRFIERDLNRLFSPTRLLQAPDGSYEDLRCREIAQILRSADISIDIHSTNKPSLPFLACAVSPRHEDIYRWFDTDRVLTDPHYILGGAVVTTDEFVDQRGSVGICYETGWNEDTSRLDSLTENIWNILRDQHMLEDGIALSQPSTSRQIFELTQAIKLSERGFRFADGMGESSFQAYRSGDILGWMGDDPLYAKEEGVILFPKISIHWRVGEPVGYTAKKRK